MDKINLTEKFALFSEHWQPKIVGGVDDYDIKIAKILGDFVWHKHDDADELFLVVDGELRMDLRDGPVALGAGEIFVVPRGVEHRPCAENECQILMIERRGTVNTGDAQASDYTVASPERI